ncbi:short chain dehydrogenase family protein [Mycobacterium avium subsp. avium 2285 (R)]|nr:short chain dehydrogenase family protein [Mycobacterium avium subsp. avium 2285 (R)]
MGLLDRKTAVITGANSGIGLATAERFLAEGVERVFITGRRQRELEDAARQLGPRATAVRGDVGAPRDLDRLYGEVAAAGAGLDIVMANAGTTRVARLGEITDDDLDTLLGTNVKGVVYTVQKALPLLNDGASIILTGSTTADRGRAGLSIYAATKAAVRSLARPGPTNSPTATSGSMSSWPGPPPPRGATGWPRRPTPTCPSRSSAPAGSPPSRWAVSPIPSRSPMPQCFWPATCPAFAPGPRSPPTAGSTKSDPDHLTCVAAQANRRTARSWRRGS